MSTDATIRCGLIQVPRRTMAAIVKLPFIRRLNRNGTTNTYNATTAKGRFDPMPRDRTLSPPTHHDFQPVPAPAPYATKLPESPARLVTRRYRAKMPQLSFLGLEENWSLKESTIGIGRRYGAFQPFASFCHNPRMSIERACSKVTLEMSLWQAWRDDLCKLHHQQDGSARGGGLS